MDQPNIISSSLSLTLIIIISLAFVIFGILYSKRYQGLENYLVANIIIIFAIIPKIFILIITSASKYSTAP